MKLLTCRARLAREDRNSMCHNQWWLFTFRLGDDAGERRTKPLRYVVWIDNEDVWESARDGESGEYPEHLADRMWRELANEVFSSWIYTYLDRGFSREVLAEMLDDCNRSIEIYNR